MHIDKLVKSTITDKVLEMSKSRGNFTVGYILALDSSNKLIETKYVKINEFRKNNMLDDKTNSMITKHDNVKNIVRGTVRVFNYDIAEISSTLVHSNR